MNVFESGPSDAKKIVEFYNDTNDTILVAEQQLNLFCPIVGEVKSEELLQTDIGLPCSYHFSAANGRKIIGFISVIELLEASPEYFPPKTPKNHSDYPRDYKTFYITNLSVRTKSDQEGELIYDFDVMRILIDEVVKQAKSVKSGERLFDGIVLNLNENNPLFLFEALVTMGFNPIGIKKNFFDKSVDSWFFELKL